MTKRLFQLFTALVVTVVLGGLQSGQAGLAEAQQGCRTFNETGKTVCGRFLTYWEQNGGLAQQGYPLTGEFKEVSETDGKPYTVQYFERAVFELHPENRPPHDVLLSLLGSMRYKAKYPNGAQELPPDMRAEAGVTFPQTGKTVRGAFLNYWQRNGGLAQQGYPLTNLIMEKSDLDGKEYIVQYFERAVFELHPEEAAPFNVLLTQLGTLRLKQKYPGGVGTPPAIQAGTWGGEHIQLEASGNLYRFELDCAHGSITQAIVPDAAGNFSATGEFVFERGGPTIEGVPEDKHPARYSGTITDGKIMTLTILVTDRNQTVGTFKMTYGTQGRLVKCL